MRNSITQVPPVSARQTTTVFTSGNSQAVRLPKAFRFDSKTVEIERRGDEIVLRAKKQTVGDILRQLPPFSAEECTDWGRIEALINDAEPQERDWNALLGPPQAGQVTVTTTPRKTRKKAS